MRCQSLTGSFEHSDHSAVFFDKRRKNQTRKEKKHMAITDLIPWKKNDDNALAVRRRELDPFAQFRREIDSMFEGMLGDWARPINFLERGHRTWMPQIDLRETAKEIKVTAELPGMEEKDLEVSLLDGALTIRGEKSEEHEEEKGDVHRSERQYGMFERVIPLPSEVDLDGVSATFKKGVLKITLPKTKEAQSNRRVIPVQS
jgi:HSP20 family protein